MTVEQIMLEDSFNKWKKQMLAVFMVYRTYGLSDSCGPHKDVERYLLLDTTVKNYG